MKKWYCVTSSFDNMGRVTAAVTDVISQYIGQITTGSVDPEPAIEDFNQALYNAGLQDIIDAKQEQLDAWLAQQ